MMPPARTSPGRSLAKPTENATSEAPTAGHPMTRDGHHVNIAQGSMSVRLRPAVAGSVLRSVRRLPRYSRFGTRVRSFASTHNAP